MKMHAPTNEEMRSFFISSEEDGFLNIDKYDLKVRLAVEAYIRILVTYYLNACPKTQQILKDLSEEAFGLNLIRISTDRDLFEALLASSSIDAHKLTVEIEGLNYLSPSLLHSCQCAIFTAHSKDTLRVAQQFLEDFGVLSDANEILENESHGISKVDIECDSGDWGCDLFNGLAPHVVGSIMSEVNNSEATGSNDFWVEGRKRNAPVLAVRMLIEILFKYYKRVISKEDHSKVFSDESDIAFGENLAKLAHYPFVFEKVARSFEQNEIEHELLSLQALCVNDELNLRVEKIIADEYVKNTLNDVEERINQSQELLKPFEDQVAASRLVQILFAYYKLVLSKEGHEQIFSNESDIAFGENLAKLAHYPFVLTKVKRALGLNEMNEDDDALLRIENIIKNRFSQESIEYAEEYLINFGML